MERKEGRKKFVFSSEGQMNPDLGKKYFTTQKSISAIKRIIQVQIYFIG